jgi:hypothetical protein
MRLILSPVIELHRITNGRYGSDRSFGNNGAFCFIFEGREMFVIASDQGGWDHVSVSLKNRTPNWREMNYIKDLFWGEEETVWQYHPPKSEYVNQHPHCLHMWKKQGFDIPLPPTEFVGVKS